MLTKTSSYIDQGGKLLVKFVIHNNFIQNESINYLR